MKQYTPTDKAPEIDKFLTRTTGVDRCASISMGICTTCRKAIKPFRDALSEREFEISGMCQACQDSVPWQS